MSKKFKFVIVAALVATVYVVAKQLSTPKKEEKKSVGSKASQRAWN